MITHNKHRYSFIALLYPLIFFAATSMFVRSWITFFYRSWPVLLVGCLLSLYLIPSFIRTKWFLCIFAYSVCILMNLFSGDKFFYSPNVVANEFASFFLFCSFVYYLFRTKDVKCLKLTYYVVFIMLGIAAIGSIMVDAMYPGIIRYQEDVFVDQDRAELIPLFRMGLSNYLLPHGIPIIIPSLILLIKRTNKNMRIRMTALLFLFFSIILVYLSGSTTALLLSIIGLTSFFIKERRSNYFMLFFIIAILSLTIIIFPEIWIEFFNLFSTEIAENYAAHLIDLSNYSSSPSGITSSRLDLYRIPAQEFLTNPLWGTDNAISRHSIILDLLGSIGLIGFIPFCGIFYYYYCFVVKHLVAIGKSYFTVSFFICIFLLLSKGINSNEIWLMLFVVSPVILCIASFSEVNSNKVFR